MTEPERSTVESLRQSGQPWLRWAEQTVWAVSLAVLLGFLAFYLLRQHALHGRLIDIEVAPPLDSKFAVDINAADWPELSVLPGISETYARRIVEYRKRNGPFRSVDDLTDVRGIGVKILEKIRPFVYVSDDSEASTGKNDRL